MTSTTASSARSLPPLLFTVRQIAEQCGVSEKTIRRSIDRGKLRSRKLGRAVRVAQDDLSRFLETL